MWTGDYPFRRQFLNCAISIQSRQIDPKMNRSPPSHLLGNLLRALAQGGLNVGPEPLWEIRAFAAVCFGQTPIGPFCIC